MSELRLTHRTPFAAPVWIAPVEEAGALRRLEAANLSATGVLVKGALDGRAGDRVVMALEDDGEMVEWGTAEVVWTHERASGLRFEAQTAEATERLSRLNGGLSAALKERLWLGRFQEVSVQADEAQVELGFSEQGPSKVWVTGKTVRVEFAKKAPAEG